MRKPTLLVVWTVMACSSRPEVSERALALEEEAEALAPEAELVEPEPEGLDAPEAVVVLRREDLPSEVVEAIVLPTEEEAAEDDLDGDGVVAENDMDDENRVLPAAFEVPCNGVDDDGDGLDACSPDLDGDGVRADLDCDDGDSGTSPLAPDLHCNGVDENCNGFDECDRDEDGTLDRDDPDPDDPDVRAL